MPQFQMPLDSSEYATQWQKATIGYFAKGYFEAMFFTECHADNPELENATISDLSAEAWEQSLKDCAKFEQDNAALLDRAYQEFDYDSEQAGRDFWFTRNGHGVGFWDRDLGDLGDKLSEAASVRRSVDLYMGDDGKLYLA
jgi:hypothetical protein